MSETKFTTLISLGPITAVLILLLAATPFLATAQKTTPVKKQSFSTKMELFKVKKKDFKKLRYLSAGGGFHFLTYFGDLAPAENFMSTDISQIKPGISAFINYRYAPRMSLKTELLFGRLTGDDYTSADPKDPAALSRYIRNLSFRNDILDLSVMSQFYVFKNYLDFGARKSFNIYINGGMSVFYHNPQGRVPDFKINNERYPNSGKWVALRPLGTEGQYSEHYDAKPYSNFQFSIPFGGGLNFKLNERLDFDFEINYRFLLTDYIDDVSGKYVDLGALDGDLAKSMSDRSREQYAVITGKERNKELYFPEVELIDYTSKYDGNRYMVYSGYGQENATRGGKANDTYLVTSFKISYILHKRKTSEY
jgi:hypothetical protein